MRAVSQKKLFIYFNSLSGFLFLFFLSAGCTHLGFISETSIHPQKDVERSYYQNGNLEYEAEFVNEKLDGTSRVWSEDGTLISDSEYSNGQPHGEWKTFHPNGKLKYKTTYFHSQKHGYERWHYNNGQVKSEQKFNFGKAETEIIRWDSDGTILY